MAGGARRRELFGMAYDNPIRGGNSDKLGLLYKDPESKKTQAIKLSSEVRI